MTPVVAILAGTLLAASSPRGSIAAVSDAWPGWDELLRTLTFRAGYNTSLVVAGTTLLGLASGVVGAFALLRRRALMADALSHAMLPGVCGAFMAMTVLGLDGRSLPVLLAGAAVSGTAGLLAVQALVRLTRLREDAAIAVVLSVFFGAGIVGLSVIQGMRTGTQAGLAQFIYGQTAAMGMRDVVSVGALALVAVVTTALLAKELAVLCFDTPFAEATGLPVTVLDLVLMALVVLVTVAGLPAVGLILVVAMLVVPPAAARFWSDRLWAVLVLSAAFGAASGYLGAVVSALLPRKPAGSVIVLVAGALFAASLLAAPRRGALASLVRVARLRLRVASDHALETLDDHERRAGQGAAVPIEAVARERGWSRTRSAWVALALRLRGLARPVPGGLALTAAGRARGERVARNHRLWEQYLVSYADVAPSHVDWSADQVEHVLSDDLVRELESALAARAAASSREAP